jgi:uncharacterized membrane protein
MRGGRGLTLLGCIGLAASFAVTLWVMPWSDERVSDLFVFRGDAAYFLHGLLPYRDVQFEYPPLAYPALALPGVFGTGQSAYRWTFAVMALALAMAVLVLVRSLARRTGGDERVAVAAVALAPLLTGAMIRNHFDLLPVALTLGALLLVASGRAVAGFAVLGAAVMTKGFPVVVAPVALAWLWARGERRQALLGAGALAAVVAAVAACALVVSPSGSFDAIRYQTDRPVQIESLPSFAVRTVDWLGGPEARPVSSYKSDGLLHPAGSAFAALFGIVGVVAVALLALGAARRPLDARAFVLASLGAVAAFATFGKVLSPQYLVWILPLGALALAWRRWALAATVGAATLLTFVEFPSRYFSLVAGHAFPLAVVAARDALLVLAVAISVVEVRAPVSSRARLLTG